MVDYLIVGIGEAVEAVSNPSARQNVGFIFVDYLANCLALQSYLLVEVEKKKEARLQNPQSEYQLTEEEEVLSNIKDAEGKTRYAIPKFVKINPNGALVHDVVFDLSEDMVSSTGNAKDNINKSKTEMKRFRLCLCKPQYGVKQTGSVVKSLIEKYALSDVAKQLIVVYEDIHTMSGSIQITEGQDSKAIANEGVKSLVASLGSSNFVRFRVGIGKPPGNVGYERFVKSPFMQENKEMDMLGYSLDLTAQALQLYASTGDLKRVQKKFGSSKKLPSNLRKMEGLIFPVEVEGETEEPKFK